MMIHVVVFYPYDIHKAKSVPVSVEHTKEYRRKECKSRNANYLTNNINNYTCFVQKMIKKFFRKNIFFRFNTPKGT